MSSLSCFISLVLSLENYQTTKALTFGLFTTSSLSSPVMQDLKVIVLLHTLQAAVNRNVIFVWKKMTEHGAPSRRQDRSFWFLITWQALVCSYRYYKD